MSEEQQLAAVYRSKAKELLTIAEWDDSTKTRETLLWVAKDYERVASNLEAMERAKFNVASEMTRNGCRSATS